MKKKNQVVDNGLIVYANSSLFSKESVFKCLYWFGDNFRTSVSITDDGFYEISVMPKYDVELASIDLTEIMFKLERDLIDFQLRDIVTKETKNIRDLLTAKAFSNGEFDELPPGEISDPVGFKVNDFKDD